MTDKLKKEFDKADFVALTLDETPQLSTIIYAS